jgi:hypothetical protein
MLRQWRGLAVGLLALALPCALWVSVAAAHPRDPGREPAAVAGPRSITAAPLPPSAEPPATPAPVTEAPATPPLAAAAALLGVLLLGVSTVRWPVPTARVLLALLIGGAAAESAVHSVHHLDDPRSGASCQVLTVTQQLHGETSPESPSGAPVVQFRPYTVTAVPHDTAQCVRRPDEGRAPPLPLA